MQITLGQQYNVGEKSTVIIKVERKYCQDIVRAKPVAPVAQR